MKEVEKKVLCRKEGGGMPVKEGKGGKIAITEKRRRVVGKERKGRKPRAM